jgi:type VI protein secretion system component VasK
MRLEHVVSLAIGQLFGRLIRRGIAMAVLALLVLIAVYHLTVAGIIALEQIYGPLDARLIVFGIYVVLALIVFGYLFATRAKPAAATGKGKRGGIAGAPQDVQMAMLLDSILLGYTAARRKSRQH